MIARAPLDFIHKSITGYQAWGLTQCNISRNHSSDITLSPNSVLTSCTDLDVRGVPCVNMVSTMPWYPGMVKRSWMRELFCEHAQAFKGVYSHWTDQHRVRSDQAFRVSSQGWRTLYEYVNGTLPSGLQCFARMPPAHLFSISSISAPRIYLTAPHKRFYLRITTASAREHSPVIRYISFSTSFTIPSPSLSCPSAFYQERFSYNISKATQAQDLA